MIQASANNVMKAVVTGGAGFIGSNLVHELVDRGVDVSVLDDLHLGSVENLEKVKTSIDFVNGDVRNVGDLEKVIDDETDVVFHQAARSSAPMHKEEPVKGLDVNVIGFLKTMKIAEKHGVDKVVYASTSSMYGSVNPPHRKGKGEEATNLYSASKMSRENYATAYSKINDLDVVGLRYFSVYGPREKAKGEYANLISQFAWKLMNDERPVIYGDGTQTRDFTFVEDVVQANILAWQQDVDQEVFDIGTGREVSLNQIVRLLKDRVETDVDPEYVENPLDNYVDRTRSDFSKAEEKLDWSPETGLEEGINKVLEFYSEDKVEVQASQ